MNTWMKMKKMKMRCVTNATDNSMRTMPGMRSFSPSHIDILHIVAQTLIAVSGTHGQKVLYQHTCTL